MKGRRRAAADTLEGADSVAARMARARTVVIPDGSHHDADACVFSLVWQMVGHPDPAAVDAACAAAGPGLAFLTVSESRR